MEFNISVEKKYFFGILGALFVLAGLFAVYAYGTNEPEVFGHSVGELDIKLDCAYAYRFMNEEPLINVFSGNPDAFEAIGIGESQNDSAAWGLGCVNDYQKTSCHMWNTNGGEEQRYDLITTEDGNNCLTDDEEFDNGAKVVLGCCKISASQ